MDSLKQKLSRDVYESLINANIRSLTRIMKYCKKELCQVTKLDPNSVDEVFKVAATVILQDKVLKANCLPKWQQISTGCSSIDAVTNGGISLNGISEIVGCSGVGKTQLCMQLALMTQLPKSLQGLEKSVVYICTEDVFPTKRFNELAENFSKKYLKYQISFQDNVFIKHIADVEQFKKCMFTNLPNLLSVKKVGLLVIDSIAGMFRSENQDVNYLNRSQDFISIATTLHKLSDTHNFAVVCVNQVTDNISTGVTEPCLGLTWSNIVTCRFNITRFVHSKVREFEVIFAPHLPPSSCRFVISGEGITAVE